MPAWLKIPFRVAICVVAFCALGVALWAHFYRSALNPWKAGDAQPLSVYVDAPNGAFPHAHFGAPAVHVSGNSNELVVEIVVTADMPERAYNSKRDYMTLHLQGEPLSRYGTMPSRASVINPMILNLGSGASADSRQQTFKIPYTSAHRVRPSRFGTYDYRMDGRGFYPRDYIKIESGGLPDGSIHVDFSGSVFYQAVAKFEVRYPQVDSSADTKTGRIVWDPDLGSSLPMGVEKDLQVGLSFCSCVARRVITSASTAPTSASQRDVTIPSYSDQVSADFITPRRAVGAAVVISNWVTGTFLIGAIGAALLRFMGQRGEDVQSRGASASSKRTGTSAASKAPKKNTLSTVRRHSGKARTSGKRK